MFALTTYRRPAASLSTWLDDFLSDGWFNWPERVEAAWTPRADVVEKDNAYEVHAELPGLDKKDINVSVEEGVLTISGERKAEKKEEKDGKYRYYERTYGSFERSFRLPDNVDAGKIRASHKNGVLELSIPKTEPSKPKQIEVKVD
jgi:HSP20 family protein